MLVIGPQTRLGDVEAGEFEVLLVELELPHVDGEAGRKTSLRCLLVLINQADQNVVQINKNKVKPFH